MFATPSQRIGRQMLKRLWNAFVDGVLGYLIKPVVVIVGAAVVLFIGGAAEMAVHYPVSFAGVCVMFFFLGAIIGMSMGKSRTGSEVAADAVTIARNSLGSEGMRSFRALCAASTYVDGAPARPLVFDLDDAKLAEIGLDVSSVKLMEEAGVIRIAAPDDRDIVGTNGQSAPADIGDGVTACSDNVCFALAGGRTISEPTVRLTWGTDAFVAPSLYGADLGIASFTETGKELASDCAALTPPFGIDRYISDAYSASIRESRCNFRYVSDKTAGRVTDVTSS